MVWMRQIALFSPLLALIAALACGCMEERPPPRLRDPIKEVPMEREKRSRVERPADDDSERADSDTLLEKAEAERAEDEEGGGGGGSGGGDGAGDDDDSGPITDKKGKLTKKTCSRMVDKYIELVIVGQHKNGDAPRGEHMAAARAAVRAGVASHPTFKKLIKSCHKDLKPNQYRCAMHAQTMKEWQDCIR